MMPILITDVVLLVSYCGRVDEIQNGVLTLF